MGCSVVARLASGKEPPREADGDGGAGGQPLVGRLAMWGTEPVPCAQAYDCYTS